MPVHVIRYGEMLDLLTTVNKAPELLKRIRPEDRKILKSALEALASDKIDKKTEKLIDNGITILTSAVTGNTPLKKSSTAEKLRKAWGNLAQGRISSSKLLADTRAVEGVLLLREAERLENHVEIFEMYAKARSKSSEASYRMAMMVGSVPAHLRESLAKELKGPMRNRWNDVGQAQLVLYEEAAKQGHLPAQHALGTMYWNLAASDKTKPGEKFKLLKQAEELFNKAAKQGHPDAKTDLKEIRTEMYDQISKITPFG